MHVPIVVLKDEEPLKTVTDCVAALEKIVLPRYKNGETQNPAYTKQECFVVLSCYFQAGKLNPRLLPQEIDEAVRRFMYDALWVGWSTYKDAEVAHSTNPEVWFAYSFKRQLKDLWPMYQETFKNVGFILYLTYSLFLTNIIRFCKLTMYRKKNPKEKEIV